ncbi:MAG TPA: hypothetical protein VEG60_07880 [Candidatus Binatia bacterium]|nr:hypothetical protein [Candidatus Binatia bacterium]
MSSIYDALRKAGRGNEARSPLGLPWQGISFERKIAIILLGLLFLGILSLLVGRALRNQMDETAVFITTNLSDAASAYLASNDVLQLQTTVTKYVRLNRVAYAFIKDREGTVVAHSFGTFPPELQEELTSNERRQVARRELTWQGKTVYETRGPILDGQLGTAHIGIWASSVDREVYRTLFMFVWPITLALFAGVIIAVFLARQLIRVLRRLIEWRVGSQVTSTHPSE